jgi:hypothetical protein
MVAALVLLALLGLAASRRTPERVPVKATRRLPERDNRS